MELAKSKFETAFAAARKSGKKTFSFGGKSYNTKLKSDAKTAPTPRPRSERPKAKTGSTVGGRSTAGAMISKTKVYTGSGFQERKKLIGKGKTKK